MERFSPRMDELNLPGVHCIKEVISDDEAFVNDEGVCFCIISLVFDCGQKVSVTVVLSAENESFQVGDTLQIGRNLPYWRGQMVQVHKTDDGFWVEPQVGFGHGDDGEEN